jgi:hypothetical protein
MAVPLDLTRSQILAYRRRAQALEQRLTRGKRSLRRVAWAGLQDSMPRAALLSIHARVERTESTTVEDPSLLQIWGPRFSAYVVAERDVAVFTLGRLPEDHGPRTRAQQMAARLLAALGDKRMTYGEAARHLGERDANRLRYAATTGTVVMRWDGARQPVIWCVPAPELHPHDAQLELLRRYLQVFGPATPEVFARWAGVRPPRAIATFEALGKSLTPARTPIGEAWILTRDEPAFRAAPGPVAPARLLPSGDSYYLLHGADRELLLPEAHHRRALWTSRVWPGAVLVEGEIAGTWRRAQTTVTIEPWHRLSTAAREAVEREAASLPLPGVDEVVVRWL